MSVRADSLPWVSPRGRRTRAVPTARCLDADATAALARDAKIGLLATIDPGGLPHVTLITSLDAKSPRQLMFGQFTEGTSKANLIREPRAAFLVMNAAREIWRGKARWTHQLKAGDDYELYNHKPMFRYNAYFGIHTVHYLDVVECAAKQRLSVARLAAGWAPAMLSRPLLRRRGATDRVLTPWAERHVTKLATLKFPAWIDGDGHPIVLPPVAACAAGGGRLLIATAGARREWARLPGGTTIALFALNLEMESVLVRGELRGFRRHAGIEVGIVDVDFVYNSMPPKQGRIYPPSPLSAVTDFGLPGT